MQRHLSVVDEQQDEKKRELAAVISSVEQAKETCRVELHFKDGKLVSGSKFIGILK